MGQQQRLCWSTTTNNARCTMPEGHTGDCIAESAWVGNIIDTGRRDDSSSEGEDG